MSDALDTGEPQGSPPSTASDQPAGGVSPLNLDRLAYEAKGAIGERAVLALVDRVRALEAVTQAAEVLLTYVPQHGATMHAGYGKARLALVSALAVVDGGGADEQ